MSSPSLIRTKPAWRRIARWWCVVDFARPTSCAASRERDRSGLEPLQQLQAALVAERFVDPDELGRIARRGRAVDGDRVTEDLHALVLAHVDPRPRRVGGEEDDAVDLRPRRPLDAGRQPLDDLLGSDRLHQLALRLRVSLGEASGLPARSAGRTCSYQLERRSMSARLPSAGSETSARSTLAHLSGSRYSAVRRQRSSIASAFPSAARRSVSFSATWWPCVVAEQMQTKLDRVGRGEVVEEGRHRARLRRGV